ncbi:MAG: sigma-54 dependent transcriptional regulator [Bacteroidales bacterium]|nr:sigma-54 dependent transcriptional regulator [Bacteroidales bacterium]
MDIQGIKQRFGIIGNSPLLNRAIDIAMQVANTDLSVLVIGESGVGKEFFPKIIHELSARKHNNYVAINCGAIPEGTIDSELFGHEKGSFTDAREARKGYFEEADKGTIFMDEVAELPLSTQVRLLRVLETGEFLKVGSSKAQKTDVRVVAATNVNVPEQIQMGKFREDLYYRLNAITIQVPSLKQRPEDIELLFRKFSTDISEKYRIPPLHLTEEARQLLLSYSWPGNVRELKNVSEQITIVEKDRTLSAEALRRSLPDTETSRLPVFLGKTAQSGMSEREILYSVLFDMQKDIHQLKQAVANMSGNGRINENLNSEAYTILPADQSLSPYSVPVSNSEIPYAPGMTANVPHAEIINDPIPAHEEDLSLEKREKILIEKALNKYRGNRRKAAAELGISERTIYRKIKEFNILLED